MYNIYSNNEFIGISPKATLNKLNRKNNCYNLATQLDAEGFVAAFLTEITDPETQETIEEYIDEVFVLPGHTMKGTEREGTFEKIPD